MWSPMMGADRPGTPRHRRFDMWGASGRAGGLQQRGEPLEADTRDRVRFRALLLPQCFHGFRRGVVLEAGALVTL